MSEMLLITSRLAVNVVINLVRIAICAANTAAMSAPPLRTESAVPEEATRQGKVPGQESNGKCSL